MKTNDVFFWSYKDSSAKFEPYHCKSQIAIFNGDILYDTFWGKLKHQNHWFNPNKCEDIIDLTYLGNLDDFELADESVKSMYDDKDMLNLNHGNSSKGNFYLRKGAVKSKAKMEKVIKRNLDRLKFLHEQSKKDYLWELDKLKNLESVEYVFPLDGVETSDKSYQDECKIVKTSTQQLLDRGI